MHLLVSILQLAGQQERVRMMACYAPVCRKFLEAVPLASTDTRKAYCTKNTMDNLLAWLARCGSHTKALSVHGSSSAPPAKAPLRAVLQACPRLRTLQVKEMQWDLQDCNAQQPAAGSNLTHLAVLDCKLHRPPDLAPDLAPLQLPCSNLQDVALQGVDVIQCLLPAMAAQPQLSKLCLRVHDTVAPAPLGALPTLSALRWLHVSGQAIELSHLEGLVGLRHLDVMMRRLPTPKPRASDYDVMVRSRHLTHLLFTV
jgi:hypothetical protein